MAYIGQTVNVGEAAPATGRYAHTPYGCQNTIILNKGNRVPPCGMHRCPNPGAAWKLVKILT